MATLPEQAEAGAESRSSAVGRNPWALAGRRLRRNRIALAALGLFLLIVALCLAAPQHAGSRLGDPNKARIYRQRAPHHTLHTAPAARDASRPIRG